jgi:hypothetical protein
MYSVGWFEVKLTVVSVVVGFRYMSVSFVEDCRVISRSRKRVVFLSSFVGVKSKFRCNLFM